jgi:hypothetical protein
MKEIGNFFGVGYSSEEFKIQDVTPSLVLILCFTCIGLSFL